ncbi:thioredoxin family protein [Coraliomargarita sinensis]|uniref:Thioredoxin family protein n=1 Tax=Coraliomargarita sinensis TaxID=2174842 RepID=A0A317ZG17_9BACT|nr:thioredoxin family protein [Coraliomargarita sinensis]PXA04360.1 thioredoxin family protein [Coraliomargarita sinensis]
MKKLPLILSAVLFSLSLHAGVETGAKAPEFTLTDTNGTEHSLSDFKGKYVVLEWTNHGCPFVKKHYNEGHMQALQEKMTDQGVVWLVVNSGAPGKQGSVTPEQGNKQIADKGIKATAMLLDTDGKVGRAYDARVTPHMYVIAPDGELIYQGAIDSIKSTKVEDIEKATNYVKAAYMSHKKGEPVESPTTTPYGCGVKY